MSKKKKYVILMIFIFIIVVIAFLGATYMPQEKWHLYIAILATVLLIYAIKLKKEIKMEEEYYKQK